jgi:F-type H+-transporting ATPase subunit b
VLPDPSHVAWVIVLVLLLSVVLDRLLLRPLTRIMHEREGAIRTARELADSARARAGQAADELDAKTRAARAEVYRQMEERRRAALEHRTQLVGDARREVERATSDATTRIRTQAARARTELEREADLLAGTIVERVLGRKAS